MHLEARPLSHFFEHEQESCQQFAKDGASRSWRADVHIFAGRSYCATLNKMRSYLL